MRAHSYLNTAVQILTDFKTELTRGKVGPVFAQYLKTYFSQHKKHGSTDRKWIGHLCYCYFRLGKITWNGSTEERILAALFLVSMHPNHVLEQLNPGWNDQATIPTAAKAGIIEETFPDFNAGSFAKNLFPWRDELSNGVDHEKFSLSFLTQPDLFIRLRPGFEAGTIKKLEEAKLGFTIINQNCLALPNASKLDHIVELDKEALIQDYNSQQTLNSLSALVKAKAPSKVWDCCAASGGKSLLCYDLLQNIDLTVTDIRDSILINLKKRFALAGIKKYRSSVVDLSATPTSIMKGNVGEPFDVIICDAPCTGSGTWSRSPEQLYFFDDKMISKYAALQKKILSNVIPSLRAGGLLVYITCSVFANENEGAVDFIKDNFGMKLLTMELLPGYDMKADTLFTSCFMKL